MMDTSNSAALPVMFFFVVLLLCLPSASTTSTSPPRSCHLAVAEDRLALPALSSSLPVVRWSGSVDRVVRPHAVYPDRTKPSRTAHTRRGYGVVSCSKSGRLGSVAAKEASTTSLAPPRQRRRAPSRRRSLCMPAARTLGYSFDAGHSHEGWCKREAAGTRSEIARGGTRRARADSDRRDPGQLLPTAQATPPRLPLLFSWARGRLPCVCVSTSSTFAKCALKALGAFFCIEYVHARFLG